MATQATDGEARPSGRVVGIVASVGGLAALSRILASLPRDFPAPVLVVQHLAPNYRSEMAFILDQRTELTVRQAHGGETAEPGRVYLAPPDRHLLVSTDGTITLSEAAKVHNSRPAGDVLFTALAAAFGAGVIAVVLTGFDGDGAAGIRTVKEAGGVTVAQDAESSREFSMPRAAIATGCIDYILPIEEIGPHLVSLVTPDLSPVAAAA